MLAEEIKKVIRDIPNFPKEGIIFKDITPVFTDPILCSKIVEELVYKAKALKVDVIAGIEARGFLFGPLIAQKMGIPFVLLRKKGKLPYNSFSVSYDLEYGQACLEMHEDAFVKGQRVLIHDDLLATGGTAMAAAELVEKLGAVAGFSFLIELSFLEGRKNLSKTNKAIDALISY